MINNQNNNKKYFRVIDDQICSEDDKIGYNDEQNEKKIISITSNPISLYKFIKDMQWFADEVYNPKLQTVASNTGNHIWYTW